MSSDWQYVFVSEVERAVESRTIKGGKDLETVRVIDNILDPLNSIPAIDSPTTVFKLNS